MCLYTGDLTEWLATFTLVSSGRSGPLLVTLVSQSWSVWSLLITLVSSGRSGLFLVTLVSHGRSGSSNHSVSSGRSVSSNHSGLF